MQADSHASSLWLAPDPHAWQLVLVTMLVSAMLSVLAAVVAIGISPKRVRGPWLRDFSALLGIGLLVPVVGPLLVLFQMALFGRLSRRSITTEAEHLPLSPYVPDDPRPLVHFGVGGAVQGLRASTIGSDKSIRALMAVEQQRSAHTTQVLYDTLGHPNESVRLTAAGLLDRRESRVLKMIRRVEFVLENEKRRSESQLAELHLEAALLNAEMLYLQVAREGMAKLYLVRWGRHLDAAGPHCADKAEWLLSKARWLEQSGLDGSSDLYLRALRAGVAPSRVMPYLAESSWRRRDYAGLRVLATLHPVFDALPRVGALNRRWGEQA